MAGNNKDLTLLDTVRELRRREPFTPFQIVVSSGDKYGVESADNLAIGDSQLCYFYPHTDKFVFIRVNQLVAVEGINTRPAA